MFNAFPQSEVDIVAPDGTVRQSTKALISDKDIILPDPKAVVCVGDEVRRKLPNGLEDTFEITKTMYYDGMTGIPAHHQLRYRQKGTFQKGTGGNYTIHVIGANARVNVHSTDNSTNNAGQNPVFDQMAKAVTESAIEDAEKDRLRQVISIMEARLDDRDSYRVAYQDFIITAAAHMTIVAPFLPALAKLLS